LAKEAQSILVTIGAVTALLVIFAVPILAQRVAFTPKPDMEEKLQRRLGFGYRPAASVNAWREQRATRSRKTTP
jgi:hypothetical protein